MKTSSTNGDAGLAQALQLLTWWAPRQDGGSAPLERLRSLVVDMNAAMLDAGLKQAEAVASLNEDVRALVLRAAKVRDPQALIELEFEIAARVRRCAAECSGHWVDAALGHNSSRAVRGDSADRVL